MPFYFAIDRGVPIVGRLLLQRSVQASIGMQWGKENNSIGDFMALSTMSLHDQSINNASVFPI